METKARLLASAPTVERITNLISRYYGGSNVRLEETEPGTFAVYTGTGRRETVRVVRARGRYRFELL